MDILITFLVNIKQGYDLCVSVTAAITRPLALFAGICNSMVMYINGLFYITLRILSVIQLNHIIN